MNNLENDYSKNQFRINYLYFLNENILANYQMNFDYSIRFVCKYLDFNNFKLNYTYKAIDITNQKEYDYL